MQHPYPLWHPVYWLATWFHSGLAPKAPGTFGTLAALPFAWVIHQYWGHSGLLIASVLAFFIGWYVSAEYVKKTGREDPKEVVIDEVAGVWLVYFLTTFILYAFATPFLWEVFLIFATFILFRLFDIWKPFPINWIDEKIKGGLGIMLDDLLAAIYAMVCLIVIEVLFSTYMIEFQGWVLH
ncbi:MAG: phosphatidylglycerophosphatase A [Rickettsiales bacterium]|nr:phosphatidylglycerophosphatase A [Rickettsiales bacterium]